MFIQQTAQGAELIVFSGIPGSGKTTEALKLMEEYRAQGKRVLRVNRDDLRTMLFGETYHDGPPITDHEVDVSSLQYSLLHRGLERAWSVISDDTNLNAGSIKSLKKIADKHEAAFIERPIIVSLEVALERSRRRAAAGGRLVEDEVIKFMFERQQNALRSNTEK